MLVEENSCSEVSLVLVEMNLPLEIRVIEKFFKKEKRDRYINFISSKGRKKFIQILPHLKDLQWDLFEEVRSFNPEQIAGLKSETSCYVISEDIAFDQTTIPFNEISKLIDSGQTFILIFGEAEQMYYEGEPPFNRYISKRL